ncbi:MAG: YdcF family protein, partial [Acetobacteraceae bacterium]
MSLRLLLTAIALPPIGFLLLAIAGWLLAARWRRAGRAIGAAALLGLLVLALPATAKLLTAPLEAALPLTPPAGAPPQAIVILSAEARRSGGATPHVTVGPMTLWRLAAGVRLQQRTHLPILVTGGRLAPHDPPIAALMAQTLAADFGTTARWQEDRSRDTWRNAAYSAPMLLRAGIRSVYI